ncbi:hypothetical protein GWI33_005510 [Rhynchophorus ferrugineus]|uniref:Uncharacterized protein n=1 Tax=Rhynchophorus ferrugineus TaxID=354439 RepID=A0A834MJI9_RHYFE|nr:hypothetical protein GWI33_005510 [Rhynchophorus ferrugineus]
MPNSRLEISPLPNRSILNQKFLVCGTVIQAWSGPAPAPVAIRRHRRLHLASVVELPFDNVSSSSSSVLNGQFIPTINCLMLVLIDANAHSTSVCDAVVKLDVNYLRCVPF